MSDQRQALNPSSDLKNPLGNSGWRRGIETSAIDALARLDARLSRAITIADALYGSAAAVDAFRGLHLGREDVDRLLAREPGAPALWSEASDSEVHFDETSKLGQLSTLFDLDPFDLDVLLIALAPELDLRYERLYAYLQDDISRKRPTVGLVFDLLCSSTTDRLARRAHFAPRASLLRHGLIELVADPQQPRPSFLAHFVKINEQILRFLLGERDLDARLVSFCREIETIDPLDELPIAASFCAELASLLSATQASEKSLRLYLRGRPGSRRQKVAEALAKEIERSLLVVDLEAVTSRDFVPLLENLRRHVLLTQDVVCFTGFDALEGKSEERALLAALSHWPGSIVITGSRTWIPSERQPTGVIELALPMLDLEARRKVWREELESMGLSREENEIDRLAGRFVLTPGQIAEAVASVPPDSDDEVSALFRSARAQNGHALASLARKIEPVYTWSDLVLPADALAQLCELCARVEHREQVFDAWGFDQRLSMGKGVNALFAGPSGTGKSMTAEVIGGELGLDLYRIDLSSVVSKYIGETEKNLDRVFRAAEDSNAILFFDEADALFGKRSEVRDSHDRYANLEISYLLQKMEQYEGVAILASNLRGHLDDAFLRRLAFTVHFPFPNAESRERIWRKIWPTSMPLAEDLDFTLLANRFKLSGGNIKNIALASAFLAASNGGRVGMAQVLQAVRREYQKMGKRLDASQLLDGGSLS